MVKLQNNLQRTAGELEIELDNQKEVLDQMIREIENIKKQKQWSKLVLLCAENLEASFETHIKSLIYVISDIINISLGMMN